MKTPCKTCKLLSSASLPDGSRWQVCKHRNFNEMFPDGRTLDLEEEAVPYWCPLKKPPMLEDMISPVKELINAKEIEVNSKRNEATGVCTVSIVHKATGIQARANEYKSIYKNRELAIQRLSAMLKKR